MRTPGPGLTAAVKFLLQVSSDPTQAVFDLAQAGGEVTPLRLGRQRAFLVASPAGVKHVLQDHQHSYRGYRYSHNRLQPLLGSGLLTTEGDVWRRHRRLAQPAFHRRQIEAQSGKMVETISAFLEGWQSRVSRSSPAQVDLGAELAVLTLSVVANTLFGLELGERAAAVRAAIPVVMQHTAGRMFLPGWLPDRRRGEYRAALSALEGLVSDLIDQGRQSPSNEPSLMGILLAANRGEAGAELSDRELRDEIMTAFIAGHETCANALTWAFYLLALHTPVQECLAEEVAAVLGGRTPAASDLERLPYTAMVFHETLRLYPPAWIMARDALVDDEILGCPIPAGSTVFLSPYVTHRLPSVWEAPDLFDPLRFTVERSASRPPFAYFPFGGGQRQCLGKNFALVEAAMVLALAVQRFTFTLPQAELFAFNLPTHPSNVAIRRPAIDMRPQTPILVSLSQRLSGS